MRVSIPRFGRQELRTLLLVLLFGLGVWLLRCYMAQRPSDPASARLLQPSQSGGSVAPGPRGVQDAQIYDYSAGRRHVAPQVGGDKELAQSPPGPEADQGGLSPLASAKVKELGTFKSLFESSLQNEHADKLRACYGLELQSIIAILDSEGQFELLDEGAKTRPIKSSTTIQYAFSNGRAYAFRYDDYPDFRDVARALAIRDQTDGAKAELAELSAEQVRGAIDLYTRAVESITQSK